MTLQSAYPNIAQWVSFCGTLHITSSQTTGVVVSVGDIGGVPSGGHFCGATVDEALTEADKSVASWLRETKSLLDSLLAGDPMVTDEEFFQVAGWPRTRNPHYARPTA